MKKKPYYIIPAVIGLFSILTLGENYKSPSVTPNLASLTPFVEEEASVTISYKAFTEEESKYYLNRDLPSRGIQPIHVTIENNSANTYQLSPEGVSLPLVPSKKVAMKVTKSAIPRAIGYKVASIFFWPFMVPSAIDSLKTYKAHRSLRKDFAAKELKQETILPYSVLHRVLFVPQEEYTELFSVSLMNLENGESSHFQSVLPTS